VFKICITDLDELQQRLRMEWISSSLLQPFVSGIVDSCRSVMHAWYTFSRNISTHCNQVDSNLANLEVIDEVALILKLPVLFLTMQCNTCSMRV